MKILVFGLLIFLVSDVCGQEQRAPNCQLLEAALKHKRIKYYLHIENVDSIYIVDFKNYFEGCGLQIAGYKTTFIKDRRAVQDSDQLYNVFTIRQKGNQRYELSIAREVTQQVVTVSLVKCSGEWVVFKYLFGEF